jgi:hypothetical protein
MTSSLDTKNYYACFLAPTGSKTAPTCTATIVDIRTGRTLAASDVTPDLYARLVHLRGYQLLYWQNSNMTLWDVLAGKQVYSFQARPSKTGSGEICDCVTETYVCHI